MVRLAAAAFAAASLIVWTLIGLLADSSVKKAVSRDAVDKAVREGHRQRGITKIVRPVREVEIRDESGGPVVVSLIDEAIRILQLSEIIFFPARQSEQRIIRTAGQSRFNSKRLIGRKQTDAKKRGNN